MGKKQIVNVGEELIIIVGKSVLHMKQDGTIQLRKYYEIGQFPNKRLFLDQENKRI